MIRVLVVDDEWMVRAMLFRILDGYDDLEVVGEAEDGRQAVEEARCIANSDIAEQLYLSEATVKTHVSRILAKLQLTNRVQAAILAHHAGLS
ncbi:MULTISPECIES: response regulator transcription factor [Kribbella]|uniref:Response regulator receiver domain-containing protein n=1 Tax=Kribbella pratensis TaxID=2512112 RepID=A0ABY2F511_9ACTN|nr:MULTISPECIES: LuxR C-terminal-related transcriptional regulator [Kribbella]TDW81631.1 response regulator receiver domain-containing protein [Kribbella pratensis]TDW83545.1 response regulator receiver domain-containing protein [Kribbella sp. VKM Ac-2566]